MNELQDCIEQIVARHGFASVLVALEQIAAHRANELDCRGDSQDRIEGLTSYEWGRVAARIPLTAMAR